jgi:hemerythrin-like metal-binding protein
MIEGGFMALFEWHDSYSVGVKELDNQHKMLIDTLNELFEAMRNREARAVIAGILKGLSDYVGVHFSYEENLMNKHGYPAFAEHKKAHEVFVQKVEDFYKKHEEGSLMLSMEVMNFLKDWLKTHIKGTDQQYSGFFNQKGVT